MVVLGWGAVSYERGTPVGDRENADAGMGRNLNPQTSKSKLQTPNLKLETPNIKGDRENADAGMERDIHSRLRSWEGRPTP